MTNIDKIYQMLIKNWKVEHNINKNDYAYITVKTNKNKEFDVFCDERTIEAQSENKDLQNKIFRILNSFEEDRTDCEHAIFQFLTDELQSAQHA